MLLFALLRDIRCYTVRPPSSGLQHGGAQGPNQRRRRLGLREPATGAEEFLDYVTEGAGGGWGRKSGDGGALPVDAVPEAFATGAGGVGLGRYTETGHHSDGAADPDGVDDALPELRVELRFAPTDRLESSAGWTLYRQVPALYHRTLRAAHAEDGSESELTAASLLRKHKRAESSSTAVTSAARDAAAVLARGFFGYGSDVKWATPAALGVRPLLELFDQSALAEAVLAAGGDERHPAIRDRQMRLASFVTDACTALQQQPIHFRDAFFARYPV
jgi:hypothetical protein